MKIGIYKLSTLCAAVALFCAPPISSHAAVVTYIDLLTTTQTNNTYNNSFTNTQAAGGAIGGFRTLTSTSSGNDINDVESFLRVQTNAAGGGPRLVLGSGNAATASFLVTWGGASGTGFSAVDFTGAVGPLFSPALSTLNFTLKSTDVANSPFTWTFRDTNNVTATYSSTFPLNQSPSPPINYAISLASFANGLTVDWSSINFITLSGGGLQDLDLTLTGPFTVTAPVPEPGTWAAAVLLLLTASYIRRRRTQAATTEEAPAAA